MTYNGVSGSMSESRCCSRV